MIHLHASRKLFKKLPLNDQGQFTTTFNSQWLYKQPLLDSNPFGSWHGNLITL